MLGLSPGLPLLPCTSACSQCWTMACCSAGLGPFSLAWCLSRNAPLSWSNCPATRVAGRGALPGGPCQVAMSVTRATLVAPAGAGNRALKLFEEWHPSMSALTFASVLVMPDADACKVKTPKPQHSRWRMGPCPATLPLCHSVCMGCWLSVQEPLSSAKQVVVKMRCAYGALCIVCVGAADGEARAVSRRDCEPELKI
jgi:hypothetical protein